MITKPLQFACLALMAFLLVACGDPVMNALDEMEVAAKRVQQAVSTNNQDEFVSGMGDMANAIEKLKPAVEAVPADKRPEYLKRAQQSMATWQEVAASTEFIKITGEIMSGPNAPRLNEIMQQMATTMANDGSQF